MSPRKERPKVKLSKAALIGVGAAIVLALSIGLVSAQQGGPGIDGTTTNTGHCTDDVEGMRQHMDSVHGEGSFDAMQDYMGTDMGAHMNGGAVGQGMGGHMGGGQGGMMGQGMGGHMGTSGTGNGGMMGW